MVVSHKSPIESLSKHDVKRIFLNKTKVYPGGVYVEAVEGVPNKIKEKFYKTVTHKSKSQLRSYWAKQVFTGKGKPPKQVKQEQLLSYLERNKNAISYIQDYQLTKRLKVIYKLKK